MIMIMIFLPGILKYPLYSKGKEKNVDKYKSSLAKVTTEIHISGSPTIVPSGVLNMQKVHY